MPMPYGPGPGGPGGNNRSWDPSQGNTNPPPWWNYFSPRYKPQGQFIKLGCWKWILIFLAISFGIKIIIGLIATIVLHFGG